jgi:hypothetical protein
MSMVVQATVSVVREACSVAIALSAGRIHGSHGCTAIIHEGAIDGLYSSGAVLV